MAAWVALLAVVAAGWWWSGRPPDSPPPLTRTSTLPVIAADTVTVHVGGWVARPGLVDLPADARVADAV
ncbi:MAG TPA: hypothetical protein VGK83_02580, partial [Acidimicrobiia bacterium]